MCMCLCVLAYLCVSQCMFTCMYCMCVCLCVCLCVYYMCVWSSAWEVGRGGDFLLALPTSDHTQAHPATPWRRSQEQDPALERRGPVLPVTFLKERLMRTFLGASGAERHGLAAEGGVGCKLTSTQEGNQEGGWCPSRPLPTSAPRAQTHGRAGWPSLCTHTCTYTPTHTHHPQGPRRPSTLTGDVEPHSCLQGHLRSLECHPTGEVGAVVLGPRGEGELRGVEGLWVYLVKGVPRPGEQERVSPSTDQ